MKKVNIARTVGIILSPVAFTLSHGLSYAQQPEPSVECIKGQEIPISFQEHTENCQIDTVTDTDVFTFSASMGDFVRILVSETTTNTIELRLTVLDPSGNEVIDLVPGGNILVDLMDLAETGTHRIIIRENGSDETGGYMVQLERVLPIFGPPPQLLNDVAAGDAIQHRTDMDFFFFEGVQDTRIQLILSETTTNTVELRLELWDPSGNPIIDTFPGGNILEELDLAETGIYLVGIRENGADETGGYELGLQCLFGPCPPPSLIFMDGFESGDTSAWSSSKT